MNPFMFFGQQQMPPWWWMQQQQPQERPECDMPPARVRAAFALLDRLANKVSPRAVPGEMGQLQQVDGVALEVEERIAQRAACELLRDYFQGKLKPDRLEKRLAVAVARDKAKRLMGCPVCRPRGRIAEDCPVCSGMGAVMVESNA